MKKLFLLTAFFICCFQIGFTQPGSVDPSFGKNGMVRTDIGSSVSYPGITRQVFSQSDGSIFVVFESNGLTLIAKKRSDGSPDSSYGTAGSSASVTIQNAHAAMQKDGKIVVAGTIIGAGFGTYGDNATDFMLVRYNPDGSLDYTFDGDGKVTTDFYYNSADIVSTVVIQSDGKILVTGYTSDLSDPDYDPDNIIGYISISRYNIDGSLDNTFNNSGKLVTQLKSTGVYSAIQTNGKIIVANSNGTELQLTRYNSNGSLDNTFNPTNFIKNDNGSYFTPKSLAIQNDGKIIAGGFWQNKAGNYDFVVARLNADGGLDNTFDIDGIQSTDFGTYNDVINSIAVQSDGKIVAAGSASNGRNDAFAIARYNTNGSPDNTFDTDGKKMTFITSNNVFAVSLAIGIDGKLVAAGYEQAAAQTNIAIVRYNNNGSLDNTFDNNGSLIDYFKQKNTVFTSSAVQKDGKIVTAGYAWNGTNYNFAIARYNINGRLDNSFSSDGIQITEISSSDNKANAVAVQADGKIVVAGYSANGIKNDFAIARYNTDGSLDKSFSTDGIQTTDFDDSEDARSIALQKDGKIVAGGNHGLVRYNTDGSLDNTFDGDGKLSTDFSLNNRIKYNTVKSVTVQQDGKTIAVGNAYFEEYDSYPICVTRYNTDGSLDHTYGSDGVKLVDVYDFYSDSNDGSGGRSNANSVSVQKDGKLIIGGYGSLYFERLPSDDQVIIARLNTNGSLDSSFAGDGTQVIYFNPNSRTGLIALQNDNKIVITGNVYEILPRGENHNDEVQKGFAVARLNNNGTYDSTFATNGTQYVPQSENIQIQSISIANDRLYTAGYGKDVSTYGFLSSYLLNNNITSPPTVSLTAPKNNATYLAPAAYIRFFAVAADKDGTISKVEFYNGTTLLHTETVFPYGFTWRNVPLGNYTLTAKAYDNSGLVTTSAPVHISVVPNKPPVVSITKPVNNRSFAAPGYIHLEAAASDTDGRITNVKFYNGATLLRTEYEFPYTYHWENVPAGTYTITAVATDNWSAHTTSAPVTIIVKSVNTMMVSNKPSENNKTARNEDLRLSLFPNPATNSVNIYTKGLQQNKQATISIISASGIVMKTMQTSSSTQTQLNVSTLAKGMYTIKIISGGKTLYNQFMKL